MKHQRTIAAATWAAIALTASVAWAAGQQNNIMRKQADGTYVVNTTSLCADVKGFKGATPLEVHFKGSKIVKIVPLKNQETPKFFAKVKQTLLPKAEGMKVTKAAKNDIDGVTGATYSSKAVKANIKAAADYYQKHR